MISRKTVVGMGGYGSGNYLRWSGKTLTTDMRSLDIRRWAQERLLGEGTGFNWSWFMDGEETARINVAIRLDGALLSYRVREYGEDWQRMDYTVPVVSQQIPNGGHRKWFLCPAMGCGRRVAILYGGRVFACRSCYGLAYPSQNHSPFDRLLSRSNALRGTLGWTLEGGSTFEHRPKGMHRRTFERLLKELDEVETLIENGLRVYVDQVTGP